MQTKTKKSIQEPIETNFLINIGDVTITPENINLVPQQYLDEYTYIFKVVCRNKFGVNFKVNIVASYTDRKWTLLKLDNYVVYENVYYTEIHTAIHNQIIPRLSMFDNVFVRDSQNNNLTLKQDLFFNGDLVTFKTIRKTTKGCYVRINVGDKIRNVNRLYATFVIDKNDINNPKFVLDAFEYDSININVMEFIEAYGGSFREFINVNINYIRIM